MRAEARGWLAFFAELVADADLVLTTYGTAVRDVDALATVDWHRLVLDEAQAGTPPPPPELPCCTTPGEDPRPPTTSH